MDKPHQRLLLSAVVAFSFYFIWTFWANSLITDNTQIVVRAAVLQGLLSAAITSMFTYGLELTFKRFTNSSPRLRFAAPVITGTHTGEEHSNTQSKPLNAVLRALTRLAKNTTLTTVVLVPLIPWSIQSGITIGANWLNSTPNLWLTVAPSILFSGLYGFIYTFGLLNQYPKNNNTDRAESH